MRRSPACRSTRASGTATASAPRIPPASRSGRRPSRDRTRRRATCASCARASCATGASSTAPRRSWTEARRAGLDSQRFRIDLESNAILEAFGGDLEETRTIPDAAREAGLATEGSHGSSVERLAFPALRFIPDEDGGEERWVGGDHSYDEWRAAAIAAGATSLDGAASRRGGRAAAIRKHGHRGARGGLRPARPACRGGGLAPRERVASAARAGAELGAVGAGLARVDPQPVERRPRGRRDRSRAAPRAARSSSAAAAARGASRAPAALGADRRAGCSCPRSGAAPRLACRPHAHAAELA